MYGYFHNSLVLNCDSHNLQGKIREGTTKCTLFLKYVAKHPSFQSI